MLLGVFHRMIEKHSLPISAASVLAAPKPLYSFVGMMIDI